MSKKAQPEVVAPVTERETKKIKPALMLVLTYLFLSNSDRQDEIDFLTNAGPKMDVTDYLPILQQEGYVDETGKVTPFGQKLVLSSGQIGHNFDRMTDQLSNSALTSLFFTAAKKFAARLGKNVINVIDPNTNQPSKLNQGLREVVNELGNMVEWPDAE